MAGERIDGQSDDLDAALVELALTRPPSLVNSGDGFASAATVAFDCAWLC